MNAVCTDVTLPRTYGRDARAPIGEQAAIDWGFDPGSLAAIIGAKV